ncbi:ThiF family adenylyltransferase [Streptococcus jiangjianxini]|uniref:ThiF family adenylyltransferase n=1 Tax=Streptococcus jiangjianxini TaxID=3161189 RepID=UPI0032EABAE2
MSYFRLKKELNWSFKGGEIIVYEGNRELQLAISTDNNTKVFQFLDFLSEFKDRQDIENYSELSSIEKQDILNYLLDKHFLQRFDNPINLNRSDLFLNSFPDTDFREFNCYRKSVKIVILGLGTVGSHILDVLIRMGFQQFILIDGDKVEEKNLGAQAYFTTDIGMYKVDALKERYTNLAQIVTSSTYVSSLSQLSALAGELGSQDIIINAADDYTLMYNLAQSIMQKQLPCPVIESGYGPLLQTAYVINSYDSAKLMCDYIQKSLEDTRKHINENSGSVLNGYMSAFMVGQLILAPFVSQNMTVAEYNFYNNHLLWKESLRGK